MTKPSAPPRRKRRSARALPLVLLFLMINVIGLPIALVANPPSSIVGWLGGLAWELVFAFALVGTWSSR